MSQFDISSVGQLPKDNSLAAEDSITRVLKEILEVQQLMLAQLQASAAALDHGARWRSLLARWSNEFPHLPQACKRALPVLERAYGSIIANMTDELEQQGEEALDNEFSLQDFLDRYGMRLGQLGNILNLVGPLAEAGSHKESS